MVGSIAFIEDTWVVAIAIVPHILLHETIVSVMLICIPRYILNLDPASQVLTLEVYYAFHYCSSDRALFMDCCSLCFNHRTKVEIK